MSEARQPGLRVVGAGAVSPLAAGTQGMWRRAAAAGQGAGKTRVTPDQRRCCQAASCSQARVPKELELTGLTR